MLARSRPKERCRSHTHTSYVIRPLSDLERNDGLMWLVRLIACTHGTGAQVNDDALPRAPSALRLSLAWQSSIKHAYPSDKDARTSQKQSAIKWSFGAYVFLVRIHPAKACARNPANSRKKLVYLCSIHTTTTNRTHKPTLMNFRTAIGIGDVAAHSNLT